MSVSCDREVPYSTESKDAEAAVMLTNDSLGKSSKQESGTQSRSKKNADHVLSLKPTSYWETLTHMLKGNIGCGMLAMGSAFKHGGLVFSSFLVVILGIIACYNQYILVTMANKFKQQYNLSSINFPDTIGIAFETGPSIFKRMSKWIRWSIELFIILTQLGFCCVYFLFLSQSLNQICSCYNIHIDIHLLMMMIFPIVWGTALIRELKYIAPLSTLANMSIFMALALILYNSIFGLNVAVSERRLMGNWADLPLCFGVVVYSLEGISLVLPLQQNMKRKEKFLGSFGVLNLSLTIVVLLIIVVGFFGYFRYGDAVRESLTLNLEAKDNLLTQAVIVCMTIGILCTYSLQFFIPILLILPYFNKWMNARFNCGNHINEYLLRTVLVFVTFLTAEIIPHLDLFVSLVGAIGGTFLALIFTPLADISKRHNQHKGIFKWRTIMAVISLIIGAFGFAIGTVMSFKEIFVALMHDFEKSRGPKI
ncbi:neutral amino acid uniporter 4-like [Planococcus citri]|uniref:neutral amino acid uniporter 4-like n=1 Tax=Planococcus citri TaxID=170843 RepID=UPI0031F8A570